MLERFADSVAAAWGIGKGVEPGAVFGGDHPSAFLRRNFKKP
jgi:hypothetical protein